MTRRLLSLTAAIVVLVSLVPGAADAAVIDAGVAVVVPAAVDEGSVVGADITYDGSGGAPAALDVKWGDGVVDRGLDIPGPPYAATVEHVYSDEGSFTLVTRIHGADGDIRRGVATVTVVNVSPTIAAIDDGFAGLNEPFTLVVTFDDPGTDDAHSVTVDWGDGTSVVTGADGTEVEVTHTYASLGTYDVEVTVDDGDGGIAVETAEIEVVVACLGHPVTIDLIANPVPPGTKVLGTAGPDVVLGTPGPDWIVTGPGDDVVCAGAGDDRVALGGGSDLADGGPGDDIITGGGGHDTVMGGDGLDKITGRNGNDTIEGGAGRDRIKGGAGNDVIDGGDGNDLLVGNSGDDILRGGPGADRVLGGAGNDGLAGGDGADRLVGAGGDDVLHGGDGPDSLFGNRGTDFLFRSESPDLDDMDGGGGDFDDQIGIGKRGAEQIGVENPVIREYVTEEEALAFAGAYLLSDFTTRGRAPGHAGWTNIRRMADTIDGYLVMPGEIFSVNGTVGRRTVDKGYIKAGAIISGFVQCCDSAHNIGGGTSQFGTTIYNAIFFAGVEILNATPHSLYFTKYPAGREATMGFSPGQTTLDVRFRNDTDNPMLITTHHDGVYTGRITVKMWGDHGGRVITATHSCRAPGSHTFPEVIAPANGCGTFGPRPGFIAYEANPRLGVDEQVTKAPDYRGFAISVIRHIEYPDRPAVDETRLWTYAASPNIVEVHPCKIVPGMLSDDPTGIPCPAPSGGGSGGSGGTSPLFD